MEKYPSGSSHEKFDFDSFQASCFGYVESWLQSHRSDLTPIVYNFGPSIDRMQDVGIMRLCAEIYGYPFPEEILVQQRDVAIPIVPVEVDAALRQFRRHRREIRTGASYVSLEYAESIFYDEIADFIRDPNIPDGPSEDELVEALLDMKDPITEAPVLPEEIQAALIRYDAKLEHDK